MSQAILKSLGEVVGTVTDWYLAFDPANNPHAGISIKNTERDQYNVYVTHADHQHQLLAVALPHRDGGWFTEFMDLDNPQWMVMHERCQGFGVKRMSYADAQWAFRQYAERHHQGENVTFVKTSPGRTVVRRSVVVDDRTLSAVPFGVILDDRAIKGERIFAQDTLANPTYGIDIYG